MITGEVIETPEPGAQDAAPSGSIVLAAENMAVVDSHAFACGEAVVFSARSPDKQTVNEDAAALFPLSPTSGVLLVADGVGGEKAGAQAALRTLEALQQSLAEAAAQDMALRTGVLNGIDAANASVQQLGLGAASTLVVVGLEGNEIRSYHVGDSMVLLVGQRGKLKLQTVAHSPVGFAVEAGLLDESEAMHHADRHLVSNVVGSDQMRIEVGTILRMAPRDTLLLASDGLFDNLHIDEIVEFIRKGPLAKSVSKLVTLARERMRHPMAGRPSKPDDVTIIAYRPHAPRRRKKKKAE